MLHSFLKIFSHPQPQPPSGNFPSDISNKSKTIGKLWMVFIRCDPFLDKSSPRNFNTVLVKYVDIGSAEISADTGGCIYVNESDPSVAAIAKSLGSSTAFAGPVGKLRLVDNSRRTYCIGFFESKSEALAACRAKLSDWAKNIDDLVVATNKLVDEL